jgi:NAD(P)H-nitrite reductase large subunit
MTGEKIIESMLLMHDRSNSLGGGFAGYGIYPEYKDFYAFHIFCNDNHARAECEKLLGESFEIVKAENIPTRKIQEITDIPLIWRYFAAPRDSFMTLDDALAIEGEVSKDSRVLILGAGLIGLKAAEGLHGRVGSITVTDISDRVLSSILDEECAALVRSKLEQEGVSFMLGESVTLFDSNVAVMSGGRHVQFDILIMAAGVRPNTALVRDIGGVCGRGITVDEHMRTSLPDIYAAGDCTESLNVSDKTIKVMALLPGAYMQGHSAGINMAGGESVFDKAIPMNSIGFFGLHIMTAGNRITPGEGGEVYEEVTDKGIKKLYVKGGKLVGFVLVGEVDRAGIYTDLIRSGTPLDRVDFDRLKKSPDLFAFDAKYREKRLGGVV